MWYDKGPCSEKHCSRWWHSCNMERVWVPKHAWRAQSSPSQGHLPANIKWAGINFCVCVFEGLQTLVSTYCLYITYCSRLIHNRKSIITVSAGWGPAHCLAAVSFSPVQTPWNHPTPPAQIFSAFQKSLFTPLHFYRRRPTLAPVLLMESNLKSTSAFTNPHPWKRKVKAEVTFCSAEASCTPARAAGVALPKLPGTTQDLHGFELCLSIYILSGLFVCP